MVKANQKPFGAWALKEGSSTQADINAYDRRIAKRRAQGKQSRKDRKRQSQLRRWRG